MDRSTGSASFRPDRSSPIRLPNVADDGALTRANAPEIETEYCSAALSCLRNYRPIVFAPSLGMTLARLSPKCLAPDFRGQSSSGSSPSIQARLPNASAYKCLRRSVRGYACDTGRTVLRLLPGQIIWRFRRIADIITGSPFGEVDERFKSHAWKACLGE